MDGRSLELATISARARLCREFQVRPPITDASAHPRRACGRRLRVRAGRPLFAAAPRCAAARVVARRLGLADDEPRRPRAAAAIVTRGSSVAASTGGLAWPKLAAAAWLPLPTRKFALLTAVVAVVAGARVLNTPSRVYDREQNTVGREYDAWTSEGILEYYWGEHIHLGYYGEDERRAPFYGGKDFVRPSTTLSTRCSSLEGARNSAQLFRRNSAQCCAMLRNAARLCAIL